MTREALEDLMAEEMSPAGAGGDESETLRRPLVLLAMFEVLADQSTPVPPREVLDAVSDRIELNEHELSRNASGQPRYVAFLRFASSWASKVGWLSKKGGWSVTEAGLDAATTLEPAELYRQLTRRYRQQSPRSTSRKPTTDPRWTRVMDALEVVEAGSWTTYADLADLSGLEAGAIGGFVANRDDAKNSHRVLQASGAVSPAFRWREPDRGDDVREVLEREGIEFDELARANQAQRMTAEDLSEALQDMGDDVGRRRAWLVRGSSVNGQDLVPTWLAKGSMSLAASRLRAAEAGLTRDDLKPIVDEDYAHTSTPPRPRSWMSSTPFSAECSSATWSPPRVRALSTSERSVAQRLTLRAPTSVRTFAVKSIGWLMASTTPISAAMWRRSFSRNATCPT
jgi:5-methylcytosine-specific restriction protein B